MQLSEVIARTRQYFQQVTGKTGPIIHSDVNTDVFEKRFREENILTDNQAVKKWLDNMTYDKKGLIHLFSWSGLIDTNILLGDLFRVPNLNSGQMEPLISALTREEEEMFKNMMRRLHTIFQVGRAGREFCILRFFFLNLFMMIGIGVFKTCAFIMLLFDNLLK